MRSKSFWEKKLEEATDRLETLTYKRAAAQSHLEYQRRRWKGRFRLKPMTRELVRNSVDLWSSKLAKLDREIHKLKTTKIPYYMQMLEREPKTVWHRIRTGDGLRI